VALRVSTLSQAATYFAASAPRSAEAYCRSAIEADASAAVPRLILVRLLGAQDEQGATEEALKIVDGLPDDRPRMSAEKRRLTARLLANRNKAGDIEKAIELVDALKVQKTEDKLLLAELYSQLGRTAAAYELFDDVVTSPSARAEDFVAFLEFWQKHFQAERQFGHRAQEVLTRLGQLPEGLPEQLRWKIRLAKTSAKESDEASTASVLEEFWASPAAKRAWKDEQAGPALLYNVLSVLLDEGCLDEAVQVCRQPPGPITPQFAARLLANVIMMRHAEDAALVDAGEKLLDELLAKFPTDVQLLQDAGDLASVGGHNDRAAAMYERVLAIDPHHESARNNLATIWNLDVARRPAALESVRKALAEHPEASSLLNTEGEILLQLDRDAEALKVLTTAANIESNSPIVYLHMAMAQDKLGRRPAAEEALVVAAALGVEGRPLSPSDREAVAELKSKYEL